MERKNFAFISYNHKDVKWAKWLQKNLETYKLPTEIHNEFDDSRFIRPVFRDQTDLNTGVLGNVLRDNLLASKFLIVLCSPNSAKSEWVSKEVQSFIEWGRLDCIIPLIVDGQPNCYNPDLECFPRYLKEYTQAHPEAELLGVSIAEVGERKAFIRVVSKMLDVSFDTLWKRHERERRRRIAINSLSAAAALFLIYWFALPVQLTMTLHDAQHQLPFGTTADGVGGVLTVDGNEYQLTTLDTTIQLHSAAGYHRLQPIDVSFKAPYYDSISASPVVSAGLGSKLSLDLKRDDTFRFFSGRILDFDTQEPIVGAEFSIDEGDFKVLTDADGHFCIDLPIEAQREYKDVIITAEGYQIFDSPEETVASDVVFLLHKAK
ncbi:MAG: TIR domain-containing protein [Bacteroidales bacterium]|nr:TIR domain-containing protein [Candidatus Liminaster caballi]